MADSNQKNAKKEKDYFKLCADKSGRAYEDMKNIMEEQYNRYGIPFKSFYKLGLYKFNGAEIINEYKARNKAKKAMHYVNEALTSVTSKSGWSRPKAFLKMYVANKKRGVPFVTYDRYDFYKLSSKEQEETYNHIKKMIEQREAKQKAQLKETRENAIKVVLENSGWTRKQALQELKKANVKYGMGSHHYAAYKFWTLTDEEQDTYFTRGHSKALREKYRVSGGSTFGLSNKDNFNRYFDEYIGRAWSSNVNLDFETFKEKFKDVDKVLYKPRNSSGGEGITSITIDHNNMEEAYNQIVAKPEGIVETFIKQHHEMQKFSKTSVNTLRVVTIMTHDKNKGIEPDKVHILYMGMRMGRGDGITDNLHAGGLIAGIDMDKGEISTDGVDYYNNVHKVHPDTGETIRGFKIPYFEEVKTMISKAGMLAEGYLGWDVAITEEGPVLIEVNASPGAGVLQIPYVPEKKGMKYVIERYL